MMTIDLSDQHIAIIGAGLIGVSWAALFMHHGALVTVWDPSSDALGTVTARLKAPLEQLAEVSVGADWKHPVKTTRALAEAVNEADLIQENAPESIAIKHALYREIETLMRSDAILASSTSALTWSDLSPDLKQPTQFITAHPFNPPHLVPLVEIYGIDDKTLNTAEAIYAAAGRVPVRLQKDATGHIANRLASALWREAVNIVAEGIADVEAVDAAMVHGPGLRWSVLGPHMAYHLGGGTGGMAAYLDHLGPSQERRWAALGTPSLTPEVRTALIEGVTKEADGRDIRQLEAKRDAALIRALKARDS